MANEPTTNLLVLGSPDVRGVCIGAGARDIAQFTAQLRLDTTGSVSHLTAALLSRLFLLVLLSFQMFSIRLQKSTGTQVNEEVHFSTKLGQHTIGRNIVFFFFS